MPTLDWIGKSAVLNHHREVPFRLLNSNPTLSAGDPETGNLLVQGDNLHALKALLPYYAGRVKCIYIDPPYNTGNEGWVYNDAVNSPEMRRWLGAVVGRDDLSRHDKWLSMMYPRLSLLWEFLSDDGSIWISMDDSEAAHLRCLCDEVFGRDNFIAANVWQKRYSRENREAIGDVHEYLFLYAKNPEAFKVKRNLVPPTEDQAKIYKNPNNDPRGRWRAIPMTAQGFRTNQMYEITSPRGRVHRPPEGRCWSMIEPEFQRLLNEGRILFGRGGNSQPSVIRYLSEVEGFVPWTWWPHDEVGHTDEARKAIQSIFGTQTAFDTPKPVRLIERVLQIATNPGDLVLDSFAGSGTTGHAVLAMNSAGGDAEKRRFILVEMDDRICREVTAERLRRVINGYETGTATARTRVEGLGGGFRFASLDSPLFDESGRIGERVRFADLAHHVFFAETGAPLPTTPNGRRSPLLGVYRGTAYYLLFNGILGDRTVNGGNVLTSSVLSNLPTHDGPRVIFGEGSRLGADRLKREGITFRQIPYDIKVG